MSAELHSLPLSLPDGLQLADRPCECHVHDHHPNRANLCGHSAVYGLRLCHHHQCGNKLVILVCQDCLDMWLDWAAGCVGKRCMQGGELFTTMADLVGPVMPL